MPRVRSKAAASLPVAAKKVRRRASMNYLAQGAKPGGPKHKLCPSEEPNEAMAERGPDGRMVPTFTTWRAHALMNRDASRSPANGL